MPLLFAVTLFVSASLPVHGPADDRQARVAAARRQPGRLERLYGVLPGTFAPRVPLRRPPDASGGRARKQWVIHTLRRDGACRCAAFAARGAVQLAAHAHPGWPRRASPPSDGSSAILGVLAILTVAIGIPFFVVSTSATLLQKWFMHQATRSARDPYFLYAARQQHGQPDVRCSGYRSLIEPYASAERTDVVLGGRVRRPDRPHQRSPAGGRRQNFPLGRCRPARSGAKQGGKQIQRGNAVRTGRRRSRRHRRPSRPRPGRGWRSGPRWRSCRAA